MAKSKLKTKTTKSKTKTISAPDIASLQGKKNSMEKLSLIDSTDTYLRKTKDGRQDKETKEAFVTQMQRVATTKNEDAILRSRALVSLFNMDVKSFDQVVDQLLEDGSKNALPAPVLLGIARVHLSRWRKKGTPPPQGAVKKIADLLKDDKKLALSKLSFFDYLLKTNKEVAQRLTEEYVGANSKEGESLRHYVLVRADKVSKSHVLAALKQQEKYPHHHYRNLVRGALSRGTPVVKIAAADPEVLKHVAMAAPDKIAMTDLQKALSVSSPEQSTKILQRASKALRMKFQQAGFVESPMGVHSWKELFDKVKKPLPIKKPINSKKPKPQPKRASTLTEVQTETSVNLHVGDALYRNLHSRAVFDEHWHTGLYFGFEFDRSLNEGIMQGANITGSADIDIYPFEATKSFDDPEEDMSVLMVGLSNELVTAFQQNVSSATYHGARRLPNLTHAQRQTVVDSGREWLPHDFYYTFADMMDYYGLDWDHSLEDIDEVRCDGYVEFCYEINNHRVCRGSDRTLWNITSSTESMDNHNDFHNNSYNQGELCPRIQAGDTGNDNHKGAADTDFVSKNFPCPKIEEFKLGWFLLPVFMIKVTSSNYDHVFLRLTVSIDNGPFQFVVSSSSLSDPSLINGEWKMIDAQTNNVVMGAWDGARTNAASLFGKKGDYRFRLVAVDPGGNVSATKELFMPDYQWPFVP